MLIDAISPIVFDADLLSVGSPLDAVLMHRPQQNVAVCLSNPHLVRLIEGNASRFLDESDVAKTDSAKVQPAEFFSRRNELVQDRDVGDSWYQECSAIPGRE